MDENHSSHLGQTYSRFAVPANTILTDAVLWEQFV